MSIAPVHKTLGAGTVPAHGCCSTNRPSSLQRTIRHPNTPFSTFGGRATTRGHRLHHGRLFASILEVMTGEPGLLLSVYHRTQHAYHHFPFLGYPGLIVVPPVPDTLYHLALVSGLIRHILTRVAGRCNRKYRELDVSCVFLARAGVKVLSYHPVGVDFC